MASGAIFVVAAPTPTPNWDGKRDQHSTGRTWNQTYDALNPYLCFITRWTSWRGLFWPLYSAMMISRYFSHCFVMARQPRQGVVKRGARSVDKTANGTDSGRASRSGSELGE